MFRYFMALFAALSRLGNALLGGNPSETISGRAHRRRGLIRKLINGLFFFQDDHCLDAYKYDRWTASKLEA
jgi:hypothetical protein